MGGGVATFTDNTKLLFELLHYGLPYTFLLQSNVVQLLFILQVPHWRRAREWLKTLNLQPAFFSRALFPPL